ncbi:MAG: type II secretion system protein [Planctomycetes bacterium]|nr:type II secretion system protein [Planctomycetota bacterium]
MGETASGRLQRFRAFTLVELLIVVIILGILAAVVIPRFSDSSQDAKLSAMIHDFAVVKKRSHCIACTTRARFRCLQRLSIS